MEIKVRGYEITDAKAIVTIINHVILNSTALYDYNPRTTALQVAIFEEKLKKGFPIIVATIDDEVVGFGYYSEFRFRDAYRFTVEHSVYVAEEFHGKGIGKVLMQKLILLAKKQKFHTMIGVIDSENESSITFHEQFGFKKIAVLKETGYKFNRWLDAVVMQLMLE
jgi:L-amino acid N-acyltransferase YncA